LLLSNWERCQRSFTSLRMTVLSLDAGAWNLVLPSSHSQAVLGIFLQPIPETIEFFSDLRLNSSEFCRIEFSILRSALREKVILDLGFCSRRPHRDARPVFQFKDRHLLFGNLVALDIPDGLALIVFYASYH